MDTNSINEMTVTQALSELKMLEKRYEKKLMDMNLMAVLHGKKLRSPHSSYTVEDFEKQARAAKQSVDALYKRIIDLKVKIAESNATTMIRVGGEEMSVMKAIILKQYEEERKSMYATLARQLKKGREEFDSAIDENNRAIERMTEQGEKDGKGSRKEIEEYINASREVKLIDPCNLVEEVGRLEEKIQEFDNNIDFILSESNSTTRIQLDD